MKIAAVLMSAIASERAGPTPRNSRRPKMPQSEAAMPTIAIISGSAISIRRVESASPPARPVPKTRDISLTDNVAPIVIVATIAPT